MVTPINPDIFEQLLRESKYDDKESEFIIKGFHEGFPLGYENPNLVKITAANLQLTIGDKIDLWNKVMKEVGLKRFAGPFGRIPFDEDYIQSPIGLVSKDDGLDTRLIFHLSYP